MSHGTHAARRTEQLFSEAGAYREGHFKLKSGRHADRYVEKFAVLQWPAAVGELCGLLADSAREQSAGADVVVGPTTGGVILAYEVARQLGVRGIFAEQEAGSDGTPRRVLRRGFRIEPGERVLLVDDVVTTGASLKEMVPLIEDSGGELVATVVLVDRTGGLRQVVSPVSARAYPASALWTLDLPTFDPGPETCPGCAAGLALEAPGSSGTAAN
ncbi:MAG TPA: orotate phosphoribosyltransferase [Candidatus Limnocylindria bacterium]|nr:orotate phosphoribosyltransferase [Candidatus Limnocylindria bacterium]